MNSALKNEKVLKGQENTQTQVRKHNALVSSQLSSSGKVIQQNSKKKPSKSQESTQQVSAKKVVTECSGEISTKPTPIFEYISKCYDPTPQVKTIKHTKHYETVTEIITLPNEPEHIRTVKVSMENITIEGNVPPIPSNITTKYLRREHKSSNIPKIKQELRAGEGVANRYRPEEDIQRESTFGVEKNRGRTSGDLWRFQTYPTKQLIKRKQIQGNTMQHLYKLVMRPSIEMKMQFDPNKVYNLGQAKSATTCRGPVQDFYDLRKQHLNQHTLFEDTAFDASPSSISPTRGYEYSDVATWLRPFDICSKPRLFVSPISRSGAVQGYLGDCWLVASIANLTLRRELFAQVVPFDQSFEVNYAGIFHFRYMLTDIAVVENVREKFPWSEKKSLVP